VAYVGKQGFGHFFRSKDVIGHVRPERLPPPCGSSAILAYLKAYVGSRGRFFRNINRHLAAMRGRLHRTTLHGRPPPATKLINFADTECPLEEGKVDFDQLEALP
jgi:hypothetical protein